MILKKIGMSLVVLATASQVFAKEGVSMKGTVSESIAFTKGDKVVKPLFSESFKVMGIGLSKGQKLEKHQTLTAAFLYVESGRVNFMMNGETTVLAAGDYFSIPAKEMHEVVSLEDSRLMLIK